MAETMNCNIDTLPELGTKAAAVAGIESMLHSAIRLREPFSPLQLRYWLDAYYQARRAQEIEEAEQAEERKREEILAGLVKNGTSRLQAPTEKTATPPHQSPAATASPQGEAMREEADGADVSAPPEQAGAEDGQKDETPHQSPAATPSPQGEGRARQRPVGWTDGFEPYAPKKASPASEAAAYKREQRERLLGMKRAAGVTMPQVRKAAEHNISDDQILAILEGKRVPVAVYRVLEAALDRITDERLSAEAATPIAQS